MEERNLEAGVATDSVGSAPASRETAHVTARTTTRRTTRIAIPQLVAGTTALIVGLAVIAVIGQALALGGEAASASVANVESGEPLSSGGITEAQAVILAATYAPADAEFKEARHGRFEDVFGNERQGPDPANADRLVWAVEFTAMFTICPPDEACRTPRPGLSTIILDYRTGSFVQSFAHSPG